MCHSAEANPYNLYAERERSLFAIRRTNIELSGYGWSPPLWDVQKKNNEVKVWMINQMVLGNRNVVELTKSRHWIVVV